GRFVAAFGDLGVSDEAPPVTVKVKFGEAIDQDECPIDSQEPVFETISVVREIEWDLETECRSLRAVAEALRAHTRPVYRAFLALGRADEEFSRPLARVDSPENDVDLWLNEWSLEIGPITSADLGTEEPFLVGWISLSLSG